MDCACGGKTFRTAAISRSSSGEKRRQIKLSRCGMVMRGRDPSNFYSTTGGSYFKMRFKPDSETCKQFMINQTSLEDTTAGSFIKGPKSRLVLEGVQRIELIPTSDGKLILVCMEQRGTQTKHVL